MAPDGIERSELAAVGGADTVTVSDLTGTDVTQVAIDLAAACRSAGDGQPDQVIVAATAGSDDITIRRDGGAVTVSGLSETVTIQHADAGLDQLRVLAGAGDDKIDASRLPSNQTNLTLDGAAGNDVILGSHGNDTVFGGQGNDVAFLGDGNDVFIWNPGDGSDVVDGQGGFDTLDFRGSNIGETIGISANGGHALFTRDVAAITMDLDGIERIQFHALGSADNITVNDLTGTDVKQVAIDLTGSNGAGDGAPRHGDRQCHQRRCRGVGGRQRAVRTGDDRWRRSRQRYPRHPRSRRQRLDRRLSPQCRPDQSHDRRRRRQ